MVSGIIYKDIINHDITKIKKTLKNKIKTTYVDLDNEGPIRGGFTINGNKYALYNDGYEFIAMYNGGYITGIDID